MGSRKVQNPAEAGETLVAEAYRSLARDPPNMLFLIADGKVVYATPRGAQVLGIAPEQSACRCEVFQMIAVAPEYLDVSQESFRRRSQGEEAAAIALLQPDPHRFRGDGGGREQGHGE